MKPDLDALFALVGENPHHFVWLLRNNSSNPHLDAVRQRKLWAETFSKYPMNGFDHAAWSLWAISDNGDLFYFQEPGRVAIVNPRYATVEFYDGSPESCLAILPDLMPDVFD